MTRGRKKRGATSAAPAAGRHLAKLRPLADAWREAVRTPVRRSASAAVALVVALGLLLARTGTTRARVLAGVAFAVTFGALALLRRREAEVWGDPGRVIDRVASKVDPERAARALRALSLLDEEGEAKSGGTSGELSRLHVDRALAALPVDQVARGASRTALRFATLAVVLAALTLVVSATNPWGILEGGDVLLAHGGSAPMAMVWLSEPELHARPPEYLHEEERREGMFGELELPRGTLLTFRGQPTHSGRRLLLTDGASEVPFVDDGSGKMVARWPLAESVTLRVVARFGDVVIEEPDVTKVTSIPDAVPEVKLEGAPKKILLAGDPSKGEEAAPSEIPIRYEATDDHGLREVHLVLRSGPREERRVLARLDGETRVDRGGHVLRANDAFLKKSHAPVEVRVEAKDNDPITGPKWGASAAITLIPPDVGEPEARRMDALRKLRDALVDTLASRMSHDPPAAAKDRRSFIVELVHGADENADLLDATLSGAYAGVRVPARLAALLRGQMRKLRTAVDAEVHAPGTATHVATVKATERMVLVVDAMIRGLGQRDGHDVARQLADVADDLVLGVTQIQHGDPPAAAGAPKPAHANDETERGVARADAAVIVLGGGARTLTRLGTLGHDIGEIVVADVARVGRARQGEDLPHAELAARDLAARLRQPDPSFGSKGRSGRGGGESGGGRGTPTEGGEGEDDAERAFNEAAQDIERLAQDHAGQIGKIEQALSGAASDEEVKSLTEDAKKHAAAVRSATDKLPSVGGGSDSWTSKGAAAREHGEQMARSLEQGNPSDAVQSGHNALQALDEAKRIASRERWSTWSQNPGEPTDAERRIDEARKKLEPEVAWSEEKLAELRKRAAERASSQLAQGGEEEDKMAERSHDIGDKGRAQGTLPAPALDSLDAAEKAAREAAQALKHGDAERGLDRQREAQRMLEMAKQALGSEGEGDRGGDGENGDPSLDHADIPDANAHKGPEEFRRRVIKGLGQPSSGLHKDAIRRYAEGLLR